MRRSTAQPAHAVDAAARPQDRRYFESWNWPECHLDLAVAARLMGKPFGRQPIISFPDSNAV